MLFCRFPLLSVVWRDTLSQQPLRSSDLQTEHNTYSHTLLACYNLVTLKDHLSGAKVSFHCFVCDVDAGCRNLTFWAWSSSKWDWPEKKRKKETIGD